MFHDSNKFNPGIQGPKHIHVEVRVQGFEDTVFISNSSVDTEFKGIVNKN